jgi:hypothetical protein
VKYISFVLSILIFQGCVEQDSLNPSSKQPTKEKTQVVVEDLIRIPQDVSYYTSKLKDEELFEVQKKYEEFYFSVWNINKPPKTLEDAKWPFRAFSVSKSYGQNLLPLSQDFFDEMYKKSNYDTYGTENLLAVTTKHSDIRAMPTEKPLLRDPSIAGEGFPFDYLQNSLVFANTPLFLSHYSSDKRWAFVFSSFAYGWVKTDNIAIIKAEYAKKWQKAKQINIIKENIPLFTQDGSSLYETKIGMKFALVDENENFYTALAVSNYKMDEIIYHKVKIEKSIASKEVLRFNKQNIDSIISEIMKSKYGWGGVYGERDCSSTLMDFYAPFGIWLPRNSSKQSEIGESINLSKLNDKDKVEFIKQEAIPFQTLLYRKGHIVLYVGTFNDEIVVLQNVWGVRTKQDQEEGRFLIGRVIFSSLKLGDELENYDKEAELLKNIERMSTITR